jgi:NAD(P)-dependent dehydrogenase (short-subunit alcohol dehydrogenase family)
MSKGVLITGASDRIGKSLALYFAEHNYNVAIHYASSFSKAQKLRNEIKEQGGRCDIFQANFDNEDEVFGLIERVREKFSINVLINNASDFYENSFGDKGMEHLMHFFNVNFKAPYILCKEFAKNVENNALIINILDTNIRKQNTKHFDYLLSKKFLAVFTKQLSIELVLKIRVNGIAPGIILPPPGKDIEYINRMAKSIPMKQKGSPENIVTAVDYLLKNTFVTGELLFVDGGENLI